MEMDTLSCPNNVAGIANARSASKVRMVRIQILFPIHPSFTHLHGTKSSFVDQKAARDAPSMRLP